MITKRRQLLSFVSLIALVATGLAQQPQQTTADRLRQAVTYLASDSLEGRRTGTPGASGAAHYIAGEFNRFGLRPGMQIARAARTRGENQARFLQPFPYVATVELGKTNSFLINSGRAEDTAQFKVGEDWMPFGFSSNGSIAKAEIVFAGYGISSTELKYDDFAASPAKDRVAIVFAGTPDSDNPHSPFGQIGQVRFRVAAARAAGVRALLIIANEELKDDRMARLSYDNSGEAGIPVMVVSRKLAAKILGASDLALSEYTKVADARTAADSPLRAPIKNRTVSFDLNVVRRESPSFNVIGILPGSDPKLKDEAIVLGAHYDHLGRGGEGSLAPREGEIHHGADDNASGTAALIELARRLSAPGQRPRRTIVFIAFSGEEEGLIGSSYYVNHPVVPLANTIAMINMDMIGRLQDQKLIIGGMGTASEWKAIIEAQNTVDNMRTAALNEALSDPKSPNLRVNMDPKVAPTGYPIVMGANGKPVVTAEFPKPSLELATPFTLTLNEDGYGPSDHSSFYRKQVPVLFFWTGTHNDYHKPSDTAEKINYEGEARIVSFVERIVRNIDKNDKRPTHAVAKAPQQAGRSSGFRVYLGTIPNYADSSDGLLLDGVRDDSPAAKAGLKPGDKIVKIAGRDVKNVYDYTYALGELKGGQEYEIEVVRGTERLKLKITPEARK